MTPLQRFDADHLTRRLLAGLISSLAEERHLVEHREEIDHLLASDRDGAIQDALALAMNANRRET